MRQQFGGATGRSAAQPLPDQLHRNRPALGRLGQGGQVGGGQGQFIDIAEQGSDLLGLEGQRRAGDLQHLAPRPPGGEGRAGQGVTAGENDMEVGRKVRDEPFHQEGNFGRPRYQVIVVQHQQGRAGQRLGQGVESARRGPGSTRRQAGGAALAPRSRSRASGSSERPGSRRWQAAIR